jgi:hypothetical protein
MEKVCIPNELGGLGIANQCLMNMALRERCLWLKHVDDSNPWKEFNIRVLAFVRKLLDVATSSIIGDMVTTFFFH